VSPEARMIGTWQPITKYIEPNWDEAGEFSPFLFWRQRNGAMFGFIRDGELFDAKWVYVCDSNKATHFCRSDSAGGTPLKSTRRSPHCASRSPSVFPNGKTSIRARYHRLPEPLHTGR
jgi:hypothetical protein